MQSILSAEQCNVLEHYEKENSNITVKYLDSKIAVSTLLHMVVSELLSGKHIAIVCKDQGLKNELLTQLRDIGLVDFLLQADSRSPIPDRKIAILRSNLKANIVDHQLGTSARYEFTFTDQDVRSTYARLKNTIHENVKVQDLPQVLQNLSKSPVEKEVEKLIAYVEEVDLNDLLQKVDSLARNFDPNHLLLQKTELLNSDRISNLGDKNYYQNAQNIVDDLLVKCQLIASKYQDLTNGFVQRYRAEELNEIESTKQYLRKQILDATSGGAMPVAKPKKLFFTNKKNTNLDNVEGQIGEVNEFLIAKSALWSRYIRDKPDGTLVEYLTYLLSHIKTIEIEGSKDESDIMKHLSLLNQTSGLWHAVSQQLDSFLAELSHAEILSTTWENNSQGLTQQVALVESITQLLQEAKNRLAIHPKYYALEGALKSDEISRAIIDHLKFIPVKQWVSQVEIGYFHKRKSSSLSSALPRTNRLIQEAYELAQKKVDEKLVSVKSVISVNRTKCLKRLEKTQKLLYQSLVKKKLPMQSLSEELTTNYFDISKTLFPIHLVSSSDLGTYDKVYYLGHKSDQMDAATSLLPFQEEDFNNLSEEKDYLPLYLNHYQYNSTIESLNNTDKIRAAKKLSKLLLSCNQNIRIYQLKEANIVSILPNIDDRILEEELHKYGAKLMHVDDLYLQLVECILATDRSQYVIVKDGLLNAEHMDDYVYQHDIMVKFNSAGLDIKTIYTAQQIASDLATPIKDLVESILVPEAVASVVSRVVQEQDLEVQEEL